MTTIKFDDYLEELKDEDFKAGYLIEKNILESAIALSNEKKGRLPTSYIDNS
jgi:hypothetical protein